MRNTTRTITKRQLYMMPSERKAYVVKVSYRDQEILMSYLNLTEIELKECATDDERKQRALFWMSPKNIFRCCKYMGEVRFSDGDVYETDD
jgi:hypothetical protein